MLIKRMLLIFSLAAMVSLFSGMLAHHYGMVVQSTLRPIMTLLEGMGAAFSGIMIYLNMGDQTKEL